ncbi:DUF4179 domain-containing protein [Clostridium malenominatum]|uniref:DUF4179 domain-containing protein n=1 Tax=Clostridium malenominatum TaxID=1539 RepID=A0ABP3UDM7_9CLOT
MMNDKDIYKLFNEVKIEESEFNDMKEEVNIMEKERIKKNLNKRIRGERNLKRIKYTSTAAALGLVCLLGIGAASPAVAKNIPGLNSIIQMLNNKNGDQGEYEKYSQIVDKSVTDKGVTLTVNEILADESKLIISYTIKSNKKIKDLQVFGLQRFLKINGKDFYGSGGGRGEYIDDYTYIASEEADINLFKAPEKFNVDLKVREVADVKGKWNFAFSVSKEEIAKNSTIFKPNKKLDFTDSVVTVDKVTFTPIGTYISLSGDYKEKNRKANPSNIFEYGYWIAFDDKGVELIPNGIGGGSSNSTTFHSEMNYTKVKDIPKYLTILPLKIIPSGGGGVSVDENGKETPITIETKKPTKISKAIDGIYPIELSQGKMGKLIIKEIKTEKDKTIVKFTAEGKVPYFQAESLHIEDDKGEWVKVKDRDIRKDEEKPNEFTKVFEALDSNKKYSICTNDFDNVEMREDLKFNIELK